jgi:hypothetical protein
LSANVIRSISKSFTPIPYIPASFLNKDVPKSSGNVVIDNCKGIAAAINDTGAPSGCAVTVVSATCAGNKVEDVDEAEDGDAAEDADAVGDDVQGDGACFSDDTTCKGVE